MTDRGDIRTAYLYTANPSWRRSLVLDTVNFC